MKKSTFKLLLRWSLRLALLGLVLLVALIAGVWLRFGPELPDTEILQDVQLQSPLTVYSAEGKVISVFGEKRRIPTSIHDLPAQLKQAFISSEDDRFYEHPGIDWQGITRAGLELIRTGEKGQGGSTITQQLARSFFLSSEKTYVRKTKEIMLALKIEREISKDEILELYLNKIFLGHRAYGVTAAAQVYYGKQPEDLSVAQMAMIAGIAQRPSRVNPITNPEVAKNRRNYVLNRMLTLGYISNEEHQQAINEPVSAFNHGTAIEVSAPYLAEMARRWALETYGDDIYESGLKLITTIKADEQRAAQESIRTGLLAYDQRHGWRGPEAHTDLPEDATSEQWSEILTNHQPVAGLIPALVVDVDSELALLYLRDGQTVPLTLEAMAWAQPLLSRDSRGPKPEQVDTVLQRGDVVRIQRIDTGEWQLVQIPEPQSALISLDSHDGAILALVGGLDFSSSKFNRVTQARRQPGSSFKPFVYAAAIDSGYHPATIVNDAPVVFRGGGDIEAWKPQNFSRTFYGPTRLREAMVHSRNLISVRLLEDIGIRPARQFISQFGFDQEALPENLSMALGSANLTPLQMVQAYATLANGGYQTEAYWLTEVRDQMNHVVYSPAPVQLCDECPVIPDPMQVLDSQQTIESNSHQPLPLQASADSDESTESDYIDDEAPRLAAALIEQQPFVGPPVPAYRPRVVSAPTVFLVRSMMTDVIRRGTGTKALQLERQDLAGKTGTTNDQRDAWFSGYNSDIATTVWVGFDDFQPLGRSELGGQAALPIWIDYMRIALLGSENIAPRMPIGVAQVWVNPDTGELTQPGTPGAIRELVASKQLNDLQRRAEIHEEEDETVNPYDIF